MERTREEAGVELAGRPVEALTFEEALAELEALAQRMSSGSVTLRESVAAYERGAALLKRCRSELAAAQSRISAIREAAGADDAGGDASAAPAAEAKKRGEAADFIQDVPF